MTCQALAVAPAGAALYDEPRRQDLAHRWATGTAILLAVGAVSGAVPPTGIRWVDGRAVDIDPIAAMLNPAALPQVLHMTLAAYASGSRSSSPRWRATSRPSAGRRRGSR